ncbi:MAG TPA: alpha/beta fold hydrolase [Devosia sp.]|nr:alpha/beta fold hydrolase [Devosia sp.]
MSGLSTLWLRSAGEARGTIIALPGLMESVEALLPTLGHWAGRGFNVLGVDPRGHGASPRWSSDLLDRHAGDVIVEDILATLDAAPIEQTAPLILFGHSAGGAAAAAVAARLIGSIRAVILEDPFWRLPITQFQDPAVAERAGAELSRLKSLPPAARIAEIRAIFPQWPEDELAAWARAKDDTDLSLVANGHVIPSRGWPTLVAELIGVGIPVQCLTGTIRIGLTANHRAILRGLGAEVTVVRGASHFVRRDARDLFHTLTDNFLDRHLPAKTPNGAAHDADASETLDNPVQLRVTPRDLLPLGGPSWPK